MKRIDIKSMRIFPYSVPHRIPHNTIDYDQMIQWCETYFGCRGDLWINNNVNSVTFRHKDDAVVFELIWYNK